jgi:hypothetical protein
LSCLTPEHLEGAAFIIALNSAISQVESLEPTVPVYSLQKDLGRVCPPKSATLIVQTHIPPHKIIPPGYSPVVKFKLMDDFPKMGMWPTIMSAPVALAIADLLGATSVDLVCFDSFLGENRWVNTTGDLREPSPAIQRVGGYANAQNGDLRHGLSVNGLPCTYSIPGRCRRAPIGDVL